MAWPMGSVLQPRRSGALKDVHWRKQNSFVKTRNLRYESVVTCTERAQNISCTQTKVKNAHAHFSAKGHLGTPQGASSKMERVLQRKDALLTAMRSKSVTLPAPRAPLQPGRKRKSAILKQTKKEKVMVRKSTGVKKKLKF